MCSTTCVTPTLRFSYNNAISVLRNITAIFAKLEIVELADVDAFMRKTQKVDLASEPEKFENQLPHLELTIAERMTLFFRLPRLEKELVQLESIKSSVCLIIAVAGCGKKLSTSTERNL